MRVWIFYEAAAFVKSLSPLGDCIHRRVDFQNQRLFLQCSKDFLPIMLVPHGRQDTEMLNVKRAADVPI